MSKANIISLLGLATATKMPVGWLRKKVDEGAIPGVHICDGDYRFSRRAAIKAVERIVAKGGAKNGE